MRLVWGAVGIVGLLAIGNGCESVARGQSPSAEKALSFDVASIKPFTDSGGGGRNVGADGAGIARKSAPAGGGVLRFAPGRVVSGPDGVSTRKMILEAYRLTQYQLSGGPGWLDSDRFSLEAKGEAATEDQLRQMLQTLLAERFKLAAHHEAKEMQVFALLVGKNGTKLHEWKEGDAMPEFGAGGHANNFRDRGPMERLASVLSSSRLERPVLDKTGLKGVYIFSVEWDNDEDFLTALQAQLGLRLESQKALMDTLIVDRAERPDVN